MSLDWTKDDRNTDVSRYLGESNTAYHDRLDTFLRGWQKELNGPTPDKGPVKVTWTSLGIDCARSFGAMPESHRKKLFYLLLGQYVTSQRVSHWTDDERHQVLRRIAEDGY